MIRSHVETQMPPQDSCPGGRWARPKRRSFGAVLLFGLFGAFLLLVVPYFLPMRSAPSDSYAFGFNNKGAIALWLLFSLGFAIWHGPVLRDQEATKQEGTRSKGPLWVMLGLATLLHVGVWIACSWYGPLQEAKYIVDRLQHLAAGERVFRDFEFAYGAGLLYLPLWLSRILHVSLLSGYCFSILIEQLIGIWLLWYVVCSLAGDSPHRNTLFVLLCMTCLAWLPLVPAQYTTFRYWLGPAIATLMYRLAIAGQRRVAALLVWIGGIALLLLVSQEQAIPLIGGVVLFCVVFESRRWKELGPGLAIGVAGAAVLLWIAYRANALETLITIGQGAYAVPIGPAPILLPILPLLLIAACVFVESIRCGRSGTLAGVLLCMSPFSVSAAFSRFDPVHLIANTFTATLVGWLALGADRVWWRRALVTYVVVVFVFPTQLPMVYYSDFHLLRTAPRLRAGSGQRATLLPSFYSPLGPVEVDNSSENLPFRSITGRFYGTTDLITEQQAAELVAEMRAKGDQPMLMAHVNCLWTSTRRGLRLYNTGLYYPQPRFTNANTHAVCDEVQSKYMEIAHPGLSLPPGWYLIRRKADAH